MQLQAMKTNVANSLIGLGVFMFLFCNSDKTFPQQSSWLQFRGPNANPTLENEKLPNRWSTTENVEWSTQIPGRGWSSPIVADGKVFLTTVTTEGKSKPPQTGTTYSNDYVDELLKEGISVEEAEKRVTERDSELPAEVLLHYFLYCVDIENGAVIWSHEFYSGHPPGGRHRKNSFASETPVSDGKFVYVYITNLGLYAYDLTGKQVWTTKLEAYPINLDFGTGSSPVLCGDQLIIVNDNEEHSFIAAFDKTNGKQIWQTDRIAPADATTKSGWVTPFIWQHELRSEIVTVCPGLVISYDLEGNELWRMNGMVSVPAASSFVYDDMLILNGGKTKPIFSIRPGATGDISPGADGESNAHVIWMTPRTGTYIPTPVAYQSGLYVLSDNGIMIRLDTKTGVESFKSRIQTFGSGGADFTSSPWAYNGQVFCLSEQGDTYVFKAGEEFEMLHVNSLGEMAMATPAIVGDRLLIRTEQRLFSIRQAIDK